MESWNLAAFVEAAPWYVLLVLIPAFIRVAFERLVLGIDHRKFFRYPPSPVYSLLDKLPVKIDVTTTIRFEEAYAALVYTALFFPLFEELVFRGVPLLLAGMAGVVVADAVWVLMHPAWQLRYIVDLPLWKRIVFTLETAAYYALNAVFYTMQWLAGYGLVAIAYHMMHNGILTLSDILSNIDIEVRLRRRSEESIVKRMEELPVVFVKKRASLLDVLELDLDGNGFTFVQRREGAEGGEGGGQ